jgi:3-hydroxybutyryl-CoA dehydrogenase
MKQAEHIKKVAVIGAGLMGHGIAQEFAYSGLEVMIQDLTDSQLQNAIKRIKSNLKLFVENGLCDRRKAEDTLSRIRTTTSIEAAAGDADFVVEVVFENLELKRQIFANLDAFCPAHTILASNTTAIMPSMLASATKRADKVVDTHYYNPPYLIPLVEIVKGPDTSEETLQTTYSLLQKVGKKPVILRKEALGFVGPRLQAAIIKEAFSIVERGIASADDVDTVVKNSFGRRLAVAGPFEVFELAGWDLVLAAFEELYKDMDHSPEPNKLLVEMVKKGELGVKTGKGFYQWDEKSAEALKQLLSRELIRRIVPKNC